MRDLLSPKQVARAIGVSEASLKRWCDKGLLPTTRTAGGHRRLPVHGVLEFLRERGQPLVRPEVLGLPATTGQGEPTLERARRRMLQALEVGDDDLFGGAVFDLFLAGHSVTEICDRTIAPVFRDVGELWYRGELEVYAERRGCEICTRVLHQLRSVLAPAPENAPRAIGGTLGSDPYTLPTAMVDIALREAGWYAESYGIGHPVTTLCAAIRDIQPRVFWLSVSARVATDVFLTEYGALQAAAKEVGTAVVVGGQALGDDLRQQMQYAAYCDTLGHLVSFVAALKT